MGDEECTQNFEEETPLRGWGMYETSLGSCSMAALV